VILPLLFSEGQRWVLRRRCDWPVCFAVLGGVSTIVFWFPLLHSVRSNVAQNSMSPGYFSSPTIPALYGAYAQFVAPVVLPSIFCLAVLALAARDRSRPIAGRIVPVHELTLAIGLALVPVIALVAATYVTQTFHVRYVLSCAIGIAMLVGYLVEMGFGSRRLTGLALLAILFWHYYWLAIGPVLAPGRENPFDIPAVLVAQPQDSRPIIVAEGLQFVPLWYYAPASLRPKLFYVTDLPFARRTTDTTNENILLLLKPMAPESMVDLNEFITHRKDFLVYYTGESANSSLDDFLVRGCKVELERKLGQQLLFACRCR
jgi:hypothetical protein